MLLRISLKIVLICESRLVGGKIDYNIEIGSSKNEQESEQNVNVNEINNTNKKTRK